MRGLATAIDKAKRSFARRIKSAPDRPTEIAAKFPSESGGLQVVEYYLWAIQRLYERSEDRFFELLKSDYHLVMDLDDHTNRPYGEWYNSRNQLSLEKVKAL
jgi:hypothetical protein